MSMGIVDLSIPGIIAQVLSVIVIIAIICVIYSVIKKKNK